MATRIEAEIYKKDYPVRLEASEDHSLVRFFSGSGLMRTLRIPKNPLIQHAKLPKIKSGTEEPVEVYSLFQKPPVEVVGMKDGRKNQLTDSKLLGVDSHVDEKGNTQPPELADLIRMAKELGYELSPDTKRIPQIVRLWAQASLGFALATTEEEIEPQKA